MSISWLIVPVVALDQPTIFTIQAKGPDGKLKPIGGDPFDVKITNGDGTECPAKVDDLGNGEYLVEFTPTKQGPLDIDVALAGEPLALAPFHIDVMSEAIVPSSELSFDLDLETPKYKVRAGGRGLKSGRIGHLGIVYAMVLDKATKKRVVLPADKIGLTVVGPAVVAPAKVSAWKHLPGIYTLRYAPQEEGTYEVSIVLDSEPTKAKKVSWSSKPHPNGADPKHTLVHSLEPVVPIGVTTHFTVIPKGSDGLSKPDTVLDLRLTNSDGTECPCRTGDLEDGEILVEYTPTQLGPIDIDVALAGVPVVDAPFRVDVTPEGVKPESDIPFDYITETPKYKLHVGGQGLKSGQVGKPGLVYLKIKEKQTKKPV